MRTIAYLIYGQKREYGLELTYSIASAMRFLQEKPSDIRILLITDEAGRREDLPVEHLLFDARRFADWTQDGHYNHAAKVHALIWAMSQSDGPVALIDTDTYFTCHPDRLFDRIGPGQSVMQADDRMIGDLDFWHSLLAIAPPRVAGYDIAANSPMKNSGVIGVDPSDQAMLQDIVPLMNELYAISPVFNIEQFAVTCVLSRHTTLTVAPDIVHHYWPYHERVFAHAAADKALPAFTKANFDSLVTSFAPFMMPAKRLPDKLSARVRGALYGWDGFYRFAYLAALSACAARDARDANAWAAIAAHAIQKGNYPARSVKRDFRRLLGRPPAWMSPVTAKIWREIAGRHRSLA